MQKTGSESRVQCADDDTLFCLRAFVFLLITFFIERLCLHIVHLPRRRKKAKKKKKLRIHSKLRGNSVAYSPQHNAQLCFLVLDLTFRLFFKTGEIPCVSRFSFSRLAPSDGLCLTAEKP